MLVVLPTLIKLLKEDNIQVQERAPLIMADLVKDSETMQKAAYEADAIPNLANILAAVSKEDDDSSGEHKLGVQGSGGIVVSKEKVKEVNTTCMPFYQTITYDFACLFQFNPTELSYSFSSSVLTERGV